MSDKNQISTEAFFYSHSIFRHEEFTAWKKEQGTSHRAVGKALQYYTKIGRLLNIRRGLYAVVPPNESPVNISIDPYLLAAKAASDSVLAYHTALDLHGLAYSVFNKFAFLTTQKIKPFEFQDQWFQPTAIPAALKEADHHFGIEKMNRQGLAIYVTNFARTFVDVLDRVNLSGGWEEVYRAINKMAVLDIDAVIKYCLMLNNRILAAKVGYFLEQRKGAFAVGENTLKPLLKHKPSSPQYLSESRQEPCQLIKKWNLIMPISVIKQTWEEPNNDI